jgi:peptidoglycan hydrolase CwlO-like protein
MGPMLTPTPLVPGAVDAADREIRSLKDTISAMRQQIEEMSAAANARVQQAVAEYHGESVQLQAAVQAMRDQLEQMRFEKQRDVQQAVADASAEIEQLKGTIRALREELEKRNGR